MCQAINDSYTVVEYVNEFSIYLLLMIDCFLAYYNSQYHGYIKLGVSSEICSDTN